MAVDLAETCLHALHISFSFFQLHVLAGGKGKGRVRRGICWISSDVGGEQIDGVVCPL